MPLAIETPTPPPEGSIHCEVRGHVLLIGINRPAKRNGWTPAMFQQLAEAYTRLDDEPALRVGVLHAFGEHFTAGLDLPIMSAYLKGGRKPSRPGWWSRTTTACRATAAAPSPWWPPSRASASPWASS
jgi:enoyl-CoA hydratase/carnithine racemase